MMSFFSSLYLWSLSALALPILIALWNLRRHRRETFGGFYLLRKIAESTTRRIRLMEILKLLNRLCLFTLLIMLFAEPYRIEEKIAEASDGFLIMVDVSRGVLSRTAENEELPTLARERLDNLLEAMPLQSRGMVGFVSDRCEIASFDNQSQTASAREWIEFLKESPIPFANAPLSSQSVSSCVAKSRTIFSKRKILRVLISPLPNTLDTQILKDLEIVTERLPSAPLGEEPKIELSQEALNQALRISVQSPVQMRASLLSDGRVEPLGVLEGGLDLAATKSSFVWLQPTDEKGDLWSSNRIFALQEQSTRAVSLWAAKESPGFLSLYSALKNHPRMQVTKQIGGTPQGNALIVYGSNQLNSESLPPTLFFLDPSGTSTYPYRDKKILSSMGGSSDVLRSFQLATDQGRILIKRYVLLEPDRFEGISFFEDGAPSLLRDRQRQPRTWIFPFDLEDLTTDITLEPAFIPFLYTHLEDFLWGIEAEQTLEDWKAQWLMPGMLTPVESVIRRKAWPGIYESGSQSEIVNPVALPTGYLEGSFGATEATKIEEKVSFRDLILKALMWSALIELLLCLLGSPVMGRRYLMRMILMLLTFATASLNSVQAASVRGIPIGYWPGSDKERIAALQQMSQEAGRLSNLDFAMPEMASVTELWKYPVIWISLNGPWGPFSQGDREKIRDYCERGGLLVFDDPLATDKTRFYQSVSEEIEKIFPGRSLSSISKEDVLFRTYYLLNEVSGRKLARPHLEGMAFDRRWIAVYSFNDLLGANLRNSRGDYAFSVTPYGISQRTLAQRMILNLFMYGVTIDYKDDAIHLPHILKRRVR